MFSPMYFLTFNHDHSKAVGRIVVDEAVLDFLKNGFELILSPTIRKRGDDEENEILELTLRHIPAVPKQE